MQLERSAVEIVFISRSTLATAAKWTMYVCINVFPDPFPAAQVRGRPKYPTYKGRKSSSMMNLHGKIALSSLSPFLTCPSNSVVVVSVFGL